MSTPIRICFSKTGYAKYISHLDMMRCMSRLFSRAGVPLWYTQGFNPHPYMVFCAALNVGTEGENELLDVKMDEIPDFAEMTRKLNKAAPEGFLFKETYQPQTDFKNISTASYSIQVPEEYAKTFSDFLKRDELKAEKKTKRGSTIVDFKQEMTYTESENTFVVTLPCNVDRVISPNLLIDLFNSENDSDISPSVKRHDFFDAKGEIFH